MIGPRALAMLKHFEGCRLHAYADGRGIATIGFGATHYADGSAVKLGDLLTQEQADALLKHDGERFEGYTRNLLNGAATNGAQFGALLDACYNAGPGNLGKSPMLALHRAGKFDAAAKAFLDWHAFEPGLIKRRAAEAALYAGDFDTFDKLVGYKP